MGSASFGAGSHPDEASMQRGNRASALSELEDNMVYELRFPYLEDKCMDATAGGTADGTNIQLWTCANLAAQRFKVMKLDGNHFQLVSINSGQCVDVAAGGTEDSTNVRLWSCNGSDAQAFTIESLPDGYLGIPNKKSGRCLDVNRSSSTDGANIQIWSCNQSNAQKIRLVPSYADTMVESFISTYLVQKNGKTYFKKSLYNEEIDYFWRQALSILSLEDAQIRGSNATYRDKIIALLQTFLVHHTLDWNWNGFNDDLAWGGLIFIRGYQITGNPQYLQIAKNTFDLAYRRGWTSELGGGIWWHWERTYKESLSNNPNAVLACYIYQNSGNAWYRDRAVEIYNWVRNTLYNSQTGAVYQGIARDGHLVAEVTTYNVGTFVEAANCLQKITGQRAPYFDDALRAIEYVRSHQTENGIMAPNGSAEFARGLAAFVRDNNLWDRYGRWMEENSRAAWNSKRSDFGVSWNKWSYSTPYDVDIDSLDAKDGVTMLQVAPL